jgi:DNA-binding NarL/FixJ family response regulator
MKRSSNKQLNSNNGSSILLSEETLRLLEDLRSRNGHESTEAVIHKAVELFAQLKTSRELATYEMLSPRLREVLRMIAEGRSTKEIATQLKVSRKTVEFHRAQLVKKLGIRAVALITRYAVRVGAVMP